MTINLKHLGPELRLVLVAILHYIDLVKCQLVFLK